MGKSTTTKKKGVAPKKKGVVRKVSLTRASAPSGLVTLGKKHTCPKGKMGCSKTVPCSRCKKYGNCTPPLVSPRKKPKPAVLNYRVSARRTSVVAPKKFTTRHKRMSEMNRSIVRAQKRDAESQRILRNFEENAKRCM